MSERRVIIDACSLINFYASGFFEPILTSFENKGCIAEQVIAESLYVKKPTNLPLKYTYEPILLDDYTRQDQIELVKLETELEKNWFIRLAKPLDDGEAATLALAIERDMDVVTDDKKAIQILKGVAPNIEILTTLDIVKTWSESTSAKNEDIKVALENIRVCANYQPSKNHHLFQWWKANIFS